MLMPGEIMPCKRDFWFLYGSSSVMGAEECICVVVCLIHRLPEVDAQKGSDLVRFMHYLSYFKAQRLMPEKSRREAGAEREELEDIMLVS